MPNRAQELAHIAQLNGNIEHGRQRVRNQISLIRKLRADQHSTVLADELLEQMRGAVRQMRATRRIAMEMLGTVPAA